MSALIALRTGLLGFRVKIGKVKVSGSERMHKEESHPT